MTIKADFENQYNLTGALPLALTGLFRQSLIAYFSSLTNIQDSALDERLFTNTDATGIMIEDVSLLKAAITDKRPAILIKRGAWSCPKRTIFGGELGYTLNPIKTYQRFWEGKHTFFCIGKTGAETETLVGEVYRYFMNFSQNFLKTYCLLKFEVQQVGDINYLEGATDRFVAPVVVDYGWADKWTINSSLSPLTLQAT